MKKILGAVALVVFSLACNGQRFGLKGGVNISSVSSDSWDSKNSKIGFYTGAYMKAYVNQYFSIQPEILYNNLGVKYETNKTSHTIGLNYIAMPIMFQFEPIPKFYLEAGPQFGLLVGSRNKYESGNKTIIEIDKNAYNDFDLNVGLGAGYNINGRIGITARYLVGLTDIKKSGSTSISNDDNQLRNSAFQFGLQYGF